MLWILVVLYSASAVLPIWGLTRLFRSASADAKVVTGRSASTYGGAPKVAAVIVKEVASRPRRVIEDLALIGGGVVAGAAASIWSLFLP